MQSEAQKEKLYDRLARRIGVKDWRAGTGLDARALCAQHGVAWNGPGAAEQPQRRPASGKAGAGGRVRKGLTKGGGAKRAVLRAHFTTLCRLLAVRVQLCHAVLACTYGCSRAAAGPA